MIVEYTQIIQDNPTSVSHLIKMENDKNGTLKSSKIILLQFKMILLAIEIENCDNASGLSTFKSSKTILHHSISHLIKMKNDKSGILKCCGTQFHSVCSL